MPGKDSEARLPVCLRVLVLLNFIRRRPPQEEAKKTIYGVFLGCGGHFWVSQASRGGQPASAQLCNSARRHRGFSRSRTGIGPSSPDECSE